MTLVLPGKRAIVIGAGMGGLAAAAAVGGQFERVTVFDRDVLPLDASPRRGTPQSASSSNRVSLLVTLNSCVA